VDKGKRANGIDSPVVVDFNGDFHVEGDEVGFVSERRAGMFAEEHAMNVGESPHCSRHRKALENKGVYKFDAGSKHATNGIGLLTKEH
jgi:hypothetical protein